MCRILGYKTKEPNQSTELLIGALRDFRMLAENGCVPCGFQPGHKDGWGIAIYKDGALALHHRFEQSIFSDKMFENILKVIKDTKPDIAVIHLRKTRLGENTISNVQPFVSDNVSFCHNGTIQFPPEMYKSKESDSFLLFFRMLDILNPLKSFRLLCKKISASYEYSAVNMLLSDGKSILAVRDWNENYPKAKELDLKNYYTLHTFKNDAATFICSEPIASLKKLKTYSLKNKEICKI